MYKKTLKSILSKADKNVNVLHKTEHNAVMSRKPHFIFSAENPMYPENHIYNLSHEKVVNMLKGKGYQVEEVLGHYGKPERSIIVHNTNPTAVKHLQDLARGLGQESSIASDGYQHEMHFHGGENEGLHIKGQGTTIHKRKPDDYFTEMKDGTSFSHVFNFDEAHPKESSIFNKPKISTKSEVDFVKSEPNHPLVNPHPDTKLIHFSTTKGLKEIDPNFQDARIKDASSKRGKPEHPVSFFYLEGAKPEDLVTSGATSKYVVRLGHKKIYDLGTDPDHIRHDLREAAKNRQVNPGTFTRDELDAAIKAKGYHGIYNSAHESEDMRKVVGMYHPTPVEKEVPFHPRDTESATDIAHEQHHSLIKNSRKLLIDEEELQEIEKAGVNSPSKNIGLGRLKQIQQDNGLGEGGKEYDMGELKNSINERSNSAANKMVQNASKFEKQKAAEMETGPQPIAFPPPMPGKTNVGVASKNNTISLQQNVAPQVNLNPEHGKIIANTYESMKHDPNHPQVKSAYGALIKETSQQYQDLINKGFKFSKMQPGQENPYKTSKDVHRDIEENKHLWYFPTEHGYGSEGDAPKDHPLLSPTEFKDKEGKPMLANDLFRQVHDINGHYYGGKSSFGPKGEHQAYLTHKKMYSPEAQKALATETLMQNSVVNYGKHGEHNRKNPEKTIFSEQKAAVAPDWIVNGKWHE